jgi:hypothetical protein
MKQTIQYIVYCIEPVKKIKGLLGALDLYVIQLLLLGGRKGIEETTDTKTPVEWYTNILQEQGMTVKSSHMEVLKGIKRVWIEIDNSTPISEYTLWSDVDANDLETLAWKPFWVPCLGGTIKESLGLNVVAKETPIFAGKYPVTVYDVLTTVLE